MELVLAVDHQHDVLIVVIGLEARLAEHSSFVFHDPTKNWASAEFFYSINADHHRWQNLSKAEVLTSSEWPG